MRAVRAPKLFSSSYGVSNSSREPPVGALLELDRVDTRLRALRNELPGLFDAALMVVADLSDDVARRVVRDLPARDGDLAHGPIVLAAPEAASLARTIRATSANGSADSPPCRRR